MPNPLLPYEDPDHPGNSAEHHTGKLCVEGCGRPAGTAWSPYWCHPCNVKRMRRISRDLEDLKRLFAAKENSDAVFAALRERTTDA